MELLREDGEPVEYDDVIGWWLYHYKGLEHMHVEPKTMYTITSILERRRGFLGGLSDGFWFDKVFSCLNTGKNRKKRGLSDG